MKEIKQNENFEIACKSLTIQATSKPKYCNKNIKDSDGAVHVITHPYCYSCDSLMILTHDGKFCPKCGRFVPAAPGWIATHKQFSEVKVA